MRLIDADALRSYFRVAEHCGDCKVIQRFDCNKRRDYTPKDICGAIDDAEIIDAIPVEWLEARIKYAKETGIREAQEAFEFVLMCWKGVE